MGSSSSSPDPDRDPTTVPEWLAAIVDAPSRWDIALAAIPVALVLGVLLGGTSLPKWAGVAAGGLVAVVATGYVITTASPT